MKLFKKFLSLLLINLLVFYQVAIYIPIAYAQDVTPTPIPIESPSPSPTETSPVPSSEVTPTPSLFESPSPSPTKNPSPTSITTESPAPSSEVTPAPSPWTFENVELNKEYIAPQNSQVKLTFTKLPSPSGNIKIEEIILTEDQIKQTGSLSEKAFDITSDMKDGDFNYNLSLPIPESSRGKTVEVKFAEELSEIGSAETVENDLTKTDTSVSVASLDHFTIFIITDDEAVYNILGNWVDFPTQGHDNTGVHYSTTVAAGDTATWDFSSISGERKVYISWSTDLNRTTTAPYVLNHVGGSDTFTINQEMLADQTTTGTSGEWSGWRYVDTVTLDGSSNLVLTGVNNPSGNDYVIADEVALVGMDEVWVDDSWAGTVSGAEVEPGQIFGGNAFATVQDGINAVDAGGTVNVAAGTYNLTSRIDVNKAVSISGDTTTPANVVINAPTAGGTQHGQNSVFMITSSDVTIQGFRIQGALHTGVAQNAGIYVDDPRLVANPGLSNITVSSNELTNNGWGIFVHNVKNSTISDNKVYSNKSTATANMEYDAGSGIVVYGRAQDANHTYNLTIDNNQVYSNETDGIRVDVSSDVGASSWVNDLAITISNNIVHGNGRTIGGIDKYIGIKSAGFSKGVIVSGNEVYGHVMGASPTSTNQSSGIWVAPSNSWQITNNNIHNNTNGIIFVYSYVGSGSHTITGNDIHENLRGISINDGSIATANNNSIYDNNSMAFSGTPFAPYGIYNSGSDTFDTTNNWWGSASGPLDNKTLVGTPNYNNPSGTGNSVTSYVDYRPWFTDLVMTTLSLANPTTEAASGETTTGATVNGTNGDYDASNTSFWWGTTSAGPFAAAVDPSSQIPSGWTHHPTGTGAKLADVSFNYGLTGLTSGTQYYFVAWSQVGGTWYPGAVLTFTTISPDTTPPAIPTLVSPADGSYLSSHTFTADWGDVTDDLSGLLNYDIEFYYGGSWRDLRTVVASQRTNAASYDLNWQWHVRSRDNVGNVSDWSDPWAVTLDTTTPVMSNYGISDTLLNASENTIVLSGDISDVTSPIDSVKYSIWNSTKTVLYANWTNASASDGTYDSKTESTNHTIDVSSYPDDTFILGVRGWDKAGNKASGGDFYFTVDRTSPALSSQTAFSGWYNAAQTSTFDYSDANGVASGTPASCDISTEGTSQTCSVTPNVCDAAGNCNTSPVTSNGANIDFTDPESTITIPSDAISGSTVYLSEWDGSIAGEATDNLSDVSDVQVSIQKGTTQYFDGSSFITTGSEILLNTTYVGGNWSYAGLTSPADGSYTIKSHATDNATNIESTYTLTIILDKTIPGVSLTINPAVADASNGWYKTQPEVTLTATDMNIDKIEYQWDSKTGSWSVYSAPFKPANEGAHILYYRSHDLAGNYSVVGIKNIKWDKTELSEGPQNVSISPNPTNNNKSTVTWKAASDNIGIDHYEVQWKLGDTSYTDSVGSDVRSHELSDLTEGDWTVIVRAFDAAGNNKEASVGLTVDRAAPQAPTLALTGTAAGSASLSWGSVDEAKSYIIWYGTNPGSYQYGANVGDTQSYTVQGLGAGSYYFIVKAVDSSGNQSGNSNEVSTGTIAGAPGVVENTPAQGFAEEVLGANTFTPTPTSTPVPTGSVLGTEDNDKRMPWWPWLFLLLLPPGAWFGYRQWRKRNGLIE